MHLKYAAVSCFLLCVRTVSMHPPYWISAQIESLGGFKILHEVDEGEEVVFRFHYKSRLQGGASVTVSNQAITQVCLPFSCLTKLELVDRE